MRDRKTSNKTVKTHHKMRIILKMIKWLLEKIVSKNKKIKNKKTRKQKVNKNKQINKQMYQVKRKKRQILKLK